MTFPDPEMRTIKCSDDRLRPFWRYPGQRRWYRTLFAAQIALQRAERSSRCPKCGMMRHQPDRFCDTVGRGDRTGCEQ